MLNIKSGLERFKKEISSYYGDNLVSLCVFGSVARNTATDFSDIDILIICEKLKKGRLFRIKEFGKIEKVLEQKKYNFIFSPIIKTKEEVLKGSPLFFDMIEHSLILYDKEFFLGNYLKDLKKRLDNLGAKRVERRGYWLWILKKDYTPGEVFSI